MKRTCIPNFAGFYLYTRSNSYFRGTGLYHQTLLAMADGFQRATNEEAMAEDMRDFARYFAEKQKLIG